MALESPIDYKGEETGRIKLLPGDYTIMPKSNHTLKILFRNSHSILITFISDENVLLEGIVNSCRSQSMQIFQLDYMHLHLSNLQTQK